jgi:outer membrane protein
MKQFFIALVMCTTVITGAQAQKFGYVNTSLLLSELPEVLAANLKLEAYQSQLVTEGQAKVQAFEAKYQDYLTAANSGDYSKVQLAQQEQDLGKEQQEIQALEKEVQNKIMVKRQELLNPILQTVDSLIQIMGKEGGYTFIFDMGAQAAMLYAIASEDLTGDVRSRLNN